MSCSEVRERLTEHALGLLPPAEAASLEGHLEQCAGCRKESAMLQEAAATVGMSVLPEEPPPSLERRVVDRVLGAAERPSLGHPRHGPRIRQLVAATLSAVLIAMLSIGWGFAERLHAGDVQKSTARQVRQLNDRIASLLAKFPGGSPYKAQLTSSTDVDGFGSAVIVSAPHADDFILVDIFLSRANQGPYTVQIETKSGRVEPAGELKATKSAGLIFNDLTAEDLSHVEFVRILDDSGRVIMSGVVRPYAASPGP